MRRITQFKNLVHGMFILSFCGLMGGCTELDTGTVFSPPGTTTTIIIVRHADRDVTEDLDPPLNAAGIIRAQDLADVLEDRGVTAIFYPALIRNRQSADPLAERVDPIRVEYSALQAADTKGMANQFVEDVLRDHAGGVVLWIGNTGPVIPNVQSGNLQETWARLGGTGEPPIRYPDLYTVTLFDDAPPEYAMETYGAQ